MARLNARHPWSHNEHYHSWILRNLPAVRRSALDVGCGRGVLLHKLAGSFETVVGIDADEEMAREAAHRVQGVPGATVKRNTLADMAITGNPAGFDLVTMVAVLHHLDLEEALSAVPRLLAPGGRLLVVGLARLGSARELPLDLVSALLNPAVGFVKHPRRADPLSPTDPGGMPVKDPTTTFAEVAEATGRLLPGAVARRRLFFRYTLRWDRPA
jgi:SAM-dependent methyltransferase